MHIGFFSHTNVGVSETFVSDLLYALAGHANRLTFISGAEAGGKLEGIDTIYTGYQAGPEQNAYRLYKLGQVLAGKGDALKHGFQQRRAATILKRYTTLLKDIDVAFVDYGTSSAILFEIFKTFDIPYVVRVLGYDITSSFSSPAYRKAFVESCHHAAGVIAVSHHLARMLVVAGVDPAKISVVHLGVDFRKIKPMSWGNRILEKPGIMHLGRLTPKKNPLALIHAFSHVRRIVPNAVLTVVGDGPLMEASRRRAAELDLENAVDFRGPLPRSEAFPLLNRQWVFAQHSVTSITGDQEGFPVSPVEAAAHEIPIVTTIHSGLTENVIDGETGFLVQEHNFEAMGARITQLLEHPELAAQMGRAGRQRVIEHWDADVQNRKIFSLLESAFEQHPKYQDLAAIAG